MRRMAPSADIEWLSTQEAARRLGITTRTLYRFVDQGELPAYRMGRVIRLQASDVDASSRGPASSPAPSSTSTPTPRPRPEPLASAEDHLGHRAECGT